MSLSNEQREQIIRETNSWLGTPYIGWSSIKGLKGGTDCGMLIKAVYQQCKLIPSGNLDIDMSYSLQANQHLADTSYLNLIETFMQEITLDEVKPGDVVLFKLHMGYSHGGIIIDYPLIIHALAHGGVQGGNMLKHPLLRRAQHKFFTLKDSHCN